MDDTKALTNKDKLLIGVYRSSWANSTIVLSLVAALEVFMLIYSVIDPPLFGQYIWAYRIFYLCLLTAALVYIALNFFVKKDVEHRFKLLNVANPIYAVFFFAWALGITYFDAIKFGTVDTMVFMTFSMTVPLSFYLLPSVYAVIALIADAVMVYIAVTITGSAAPLINISIFCIFQLVLGVNFLRLKMRLTERILEEQRNADIDVLTGFPNRRFYEKDMRRLAESPMQSDLVYISIDLNGLKEVNDNYGHEAGDKLIVGTAQCIEQCFCQKGKSYRIGGDEFVVIAHASPDEIERLFSDFEARMKAWSQDNETTMSAAYGYVCQSEFPDKKVTELVRIADERMYTSKAHYYQESGHDRRTYRFVETE